MKRLVIIFASLAAVVAMVLLVGRHGSAQITIECGRPALGVGPYGNAYVTVWITNHAVHAQLVDLDSIQIRTEMGWGVYLQASPTTLKMRSLSGGPSLGMGTVLAPHSAACFEIREPGGFPTSPWRLSLSAGQQLSGMEELWARIKISWEQRTAPLLSRGGSFDPWGKNTTFWGHHVQVLSQVTEGVPENLRTEILSGLMTNLSSAVAGTRYEAAVALQWSGPEAAPAMGLLAARLSDPDENVRNASVRALGRIGPSASNALPALQALLEAESSWTRSAAKEAIEQIQKPVNAASP